MEESKGTSTLPNDWRVFQNETGSYLCGSLLVEHLFLILHAGWSNAPTGACFLFMIVVMPSLVLRDACRRLLLNECSASGFHHLYVLVDFMVVLRVVLMQIDNDLKFCFMIIGSFTYLPSSSLPSS